MRRKPEPPIIGIDEDNNLWINGKIANEGDRILFTLDDITEVVKINDILIWNATGYDWICMAKIEVHLSNGYILESIKEIEEMLSW